MSVFLFTMHLISVLGLSYIIAVRSKDDPSSFFSLKIIALIILDIASVFAALFQGLSVIRIFV